MAVVTIRQLLDSGVHFGHQTRRWNPKVKRFILTERSGIHIIDLQQSLAYIDKAYDFVKETVAHGGTVLFVGTKKQAQEAIAEQAQRVGQPYVNQRWLGGLLTNFQTVSKRLARMKELEEIDFDDTTKGFTKKELLIKKRELDKLHKSLGGIRNMSKTPSAIWVVDAKREHLAVNEATKLGIPVIGILDTNADPDELQYPIPGNDDAIRSVGLLTRIIADAAAEGLIQRHQKPEAEGNVSAVEPLAEWERELLETSETPSSEAEKIEAVDGEVAGAPDVAAVAEVVAAETPVEENDADAVVAAHEAAADPTVVPHHAPESDDFTEARIEAEEVVPTPPTDEAPKAPVKRAAKAKPAEDDADAEAPVADKAPAAKKPAAKAAPKADK
jgi:small subunit ribosomal protein S2